MCYATGGPGLAHCQLLARATVPDCGCEGHPTVAMGTSHSQSWVVEGGTVLHPHSLLLEPPEMLLWELPRCQGLPPAHPLRARRWGAGSGHPPHLQLLLWRKALNISKTPASQCTVFSLSSRWKRAEPGSRQDGEQNRSLFSFTHRVAWWGGREV